MNRKEKRMAFKRGTYTAADLEPTLDAILATVGRAADVLIEFAAKQDADRYGEVRELVRTGHLIPQTVLMPGLMVVSLVKAGTGENIGEIFSYRVPIGTEERGAAH